MCGYLCFSICRTHWIPGGKSLLFVGYRHDSSLSIILTPTHRCESCFARLRARSAEGKWGRLAGTGGRGTSYAGIAVPPFLTRTNSPSPHARGADLQTCLNGASQRHQWERAAAFQRTRPQVKRVERRKQPGAGSVVA